MDADDGIVWFLRGSVRDLGGVMVLTLEGRVSNATVPDLERLLASAPDSRLRGLVVDLSGVDYINGTGIRTITAAAASLRSAGTELVLCGLRPVVQTGFDIAGPFADLAFEPSTDAAVSRLLERHP